MPSELTLKAREILLDFRMSLEALANGETTVDEAFDELMLLVPQAQALSRPVSDEVLVEKVARAIFEVHAEAEHGDTWEALSEGWRENLREHARAAIAALNAQPVEERG